MIAWEKAVHVGTAVIRMKRCLFTMRKGKCLKSNILKNIHTLHYTNIHNTGISPSLCSAAISSVSVRLLFRVLAFYLNVQIWLVHWAAVQSLSTFENWFPSWHCSHHSSKQQVFLESNKNKSVEVFLTTSISGSQRFSFMEPCSINEQTDWPHV